jgi:hypothetical protein
LIDSSSISIEGKTIEIDAKITLSQVDVGLYYRIDEQLTAIPAGRYIVRYVAEVRQPPGVPNYTPSTVVGLWDLVVNASGLSHVEPVPPVTGVQISSWTFMPTPPSPSCGWIFTTRSASVSDNNVLINYSAVPPAMPNLCFPEPPPFILTVAIGTLTAGNYTATVQGDYAGVANPPIGFSFTVLPLPVPAIEYYLAAKDHYFITADPNEVNLLDNGYFPGWVRTGQTISVFPAVEVPSGNPAPVCRFYGLPQAGLDSHFYSASPAECQGVSDRFPNSWALESTNVFIAYLPNVADGSCPLNTSPVYRLYDNRSDVDHRYTTSLAIREQMISAGWLPEGYGPEAVAFCAP